MGKSIDKIDSKWLDDMAREIQKDTPPESPFRLSLGELVFSKRYGGNAVVIQRGIIEDEKGIHIMYFLEGSSEDGTMRFEDWHTTLFIERHKI